MDSQRDCDLHRGKRSIVTWTIDNFPTILITFGIIAGVCVVIGWIVIHRRKQHRKLLRQSGGRKDATRPEDEKAS
ncbi:MAG: hypothetical protein RBG13Loki_3182 [Promethearchaeota archaeon CR_4]|nr:MAG: hypothetical protein RBG13Loki_3182 [Candidatus Lokiarchaeota archaeon CR_4]